VGNQRSFIAFALATLVGAILPLGPAQAAPSCLGATATIVGTAEADHLEGTAGRDVISGLGGHDRIESMGGDDLVCGDAGRDDIQAGTGDDRLDGGDDRDFLRGEGGADEIFARGGDDSLYGEQGADRLIGGPGNNNLDGGDGEDRLEGAEGEDYLSGGDGPDTVLAGPGPDTLFGGLSNDRFSGGGDDDRMYAEGVRPTDEDPDLDDGDDRYEGGPGVDLVNYASTAQAVHVSLARGTAEGNGSDRLAEVEDLVGTSYDDDLEGDGDDNRFAGGAGDDRLDGAGGIDAVDFSGSRRKVVVNLAGRAATGDGEDELLQIENVIGSPSNDFIIGDEQANRLHGGRSGRDTLRGLAGNDVLIGGLDEVDRAGNPLFIEEDVLIGGPGDDELDGAFGEDTADFGSSAVGVTADLSAGHATGEGDDRLRGIEDLAGSGYSDQLIGSTEANEIDGRAGNDTLGGLDGDDVFVGGTGDDTFHGGAGRDAIDFGRSRTPITADLGGGTVTGEGTDTLAEVEDLYGSTKPDALTGDDSANYLNGRTSADTIVGGGGNDVIVGLKGEDDLDGGDADDMIYDGEHDDSVVGGSGDDYVRTGIGDDDFDGGEGMDTLEFFDSSRGMTVDLNSGTTSTFGDQGSDTVAGIENILGTIETDEFYGDEQENYFVGFGGVDEFLGGAGDDLLEPMGGADIADGEDGADTTVFDAAPRPVIVDLASAFATGYGSDTLLSLENVIGSRWPDIFRGSDDPNVMWGGLAGDILEGTAGDDRLDGGEGFDTLDGGAGTDACMNGESELDCEGAGGIGEAQAAHDRFVAFRALMFRWQTTEKSMIGAPSFPYLPRTSPTSLYVPG
jgi:Ca2+-binding RTX toxin-like protein